MQIKEFPEKNPEIKKYKLGMQEYYKGWKKKRNLSFSLGRKSKCIPVS